MGGGPMGVAYVRLATIGASSGRAELARRNEAGVLEKGVPPTARRRAAVIVVAGSMVGEGGGRFRGRGEESCPSSAAVFSSRRVSQIAVVVGRREGRLEGGQKW